MVVLFSLISGIVRLLRTSGSCGLGGDSLWGDRSSKEFDLSYSKMAFVDG